MTKFKTTQNAKPSIGEKNSGKIVTVPDQTFTTRQLLQRQTQGIHTMNTKYPVYNPDYYGPDIKAMDLIDVQEAKILLQSKIDNSKIKLDEIKAEKQRRKTIIPLEEESDKPDS